MMVGLTPYRLYRMYMQETKESSLRVAEQSNQSQLLQSYFKRLGLSDGGSFSWAYVLGLLALGAASASFVAMLYRSWKSYVLNKGHTIDNGRVDPLSSADEAAMQAVAPLLLAAETAAALDETATMPSEDLMELEINLRTLISAMDAQLDELKYSLESSLPEGAREQLADIEEQRSSAEMFIDSTESTAQPDIIYDESIDQLDWKEFAVYSQHCSDDVKRTYRSLLFNRRIQQKLLQQVVSQMSSREESYYSQSGDNGKEVDNTVGDIDALRLAVGGALQPHQDKKATGGEDAFFASNANKAFGIADGVGGWAASGIDPSEYSRGMIAACELAANSENGPMEILEEAFNKTTIPGSCTIALAKFQGSVMKVVSLGDCSTKILRDGRVISSTKVQEHSWNQPYQISSPSFNIADKPCDALEYEFEVKAGDVVIMGSDGFWDNIWDDEVEEAIRAGDNMRRSYDGVAGWEEEASEIAQRLASLAEEHSIDSGYASPFAQEKQLMRYPKMFQSFMPRGVGGKMDDICVVVALIYDYATVSSSEN